MEGDDSLLTTEDNNKEVVELEVAPALISVHPAHHSVAVAVGCELRVFNLREGCPVTLGAESGEVCHHKDSIRAIRYGAKGNVFVSAGDDKLVKIWTTDSWRCMYSVSTEKKVSAVAISDNGQFVCYADKFGVVWVVELDEFNENQALVQKKGSPLLAHYCSIITSLEFSPDGQFIITADRDFKIRVTMFPKKPLDGAHEIQSYCLGHTEFVSCLAFVYNVDCPHGYLVSGSGDSTVRLWDFTSGLLLNTCDVGSEVGRLMANGTESNYFAITDLCATCDGSSICVAVQGLPGILLLTCNLLAKTLSILKVVSINGEDFIPTSIGTSLTSNFLWMVMGVSNLPGFDSSSLARVRIISGLTNCNSESGDQNHNILEDQQVPGGETLLQQLQGSLSIDKDVFSAAAEAVKTSMRNLLIKKQYSSEKREFRKRGRNDRKAKR
ncbi:tRNA (guanine-N(7)-)-methyltransferase non-catalytic subunit wdr4 [Cynara cardunculus var. scolymus]|uniref:tRNA (guanine-N(7)-)-methyltransferase non-catalytic subunit wdr4 n=1 Tax=Cynara cardunculus var. scolymus TaxID=59895 RepID=UPI000D626C62|nr:tRNA (guanine-N(7)-)-methyltransferase non-catalytic subunit wdr4 [Cynara cardunculus var. scolymus]